MILVHGGAGAVPPERHARLRAGVRAAAAAGKAVLDRGGHALDAVVAAVRVLEDDPEFSAGVGSMLTRIGSVENCATVMDGKQRRAGAVAAVPDLGAPVIVARAVLERGEHVLLAGEAASRYAAEIGFEPAAPGSLITPLAMQAFQAVQLAGGRINASGSKPVATEGGGVGAVARDAQGNFAAATSTGGTVFRRPGAVDDAAVPGVGTWADDHCAISTSGGEALFRVALAANIATRINEGHGIRNATTKALDQLKELTPNGIAGVIVIDKKSWSALQLGPTMPVAWFDELGSSDEIGFPY